MTILNAQGQAIASKRRVGLQIVIVDEQPGRAGAEKAVMGFELDSNDPVAISNLMQAINQSVLRRLHDIGFLGSTPDVETGGIDAEDGKGRE